MRIWKRVYPRASGSLSVREGLKYPQLRPARWARGAYFTQRFPEGFERTPLRTITDGNDSRLALHEEPDRDRVLVRVLATKTASGQIPTRPCVDTSSADHRKGVRTAAEDVVAENLDRAAGQVADGGELRDLRR